jgi:hypothetical protein
METIYRKVKTAERLPEKEGRYIVQNSDVDHPEYMLFNKTTEAFFGFTIWWLEEVELPRDEEIELDRPYKTTISNEQLFKNIGFICGVRYLKDFITRKV